MSFWDDLGDFLVLVLNERYRLGVLTYSQRKSLLHLLYKKDDRRLPKNWCPISLLSTDYKLASKAITEFHRSPRSDCGVVGRSIFSNLQLIRDTLDMIDKTDEPGILVTLDQEKAFDHVDHEFLIRTLAKFGFSPSFCNWVALFHNDVFSRTIRNGNLCMPVFLGRGVRQGCTLSPLLYVLVLEVLSTQIRRCKQIEGFQLPGARGLQLKVFQYVDDVRSERSLCHLLRVVNVYEKGSGAKLNTTMSEAMWLGRWRTNGASPFGLTGVFKMKILGGYFSNGLVSVEADNWKSKLDKLQNVVNLSKQRALSLLGQAMIINALGTSCFWHTAKIIIPPQWVVDSYDKFVWSFMWPGKTENVSRQRCSAPLCGGGLNVVDFRPSVLLFVCLIFLVYVMILAVKGGIFLLVIFSGIVCKNLTRDLVFFLILFLFLLHLLTFIGLVFLFSSKSLINMVHCPTFFCVRIFIYFRLFFPMLRLSLLQLVFGDPLSVAPSTSGLRCGVNLAKRLLRKKRMI